MIRLLKAGVASVLLGATSLAAVQPAQAHDNTGVAVVAGIIGLGVGAAIAFDHPHYRQVQYGYGGYSQAQPYYYPQQYRGGDGYQYGSDWQRHRSWEQRRWQEARQREWQREHWQHRDWHHDRDDDDDDGYGY